MCDNWGLERLGKKIYAESIDEMKHADQLIERVLYLDGLPNVQRLGRVRIGEDVREVIVSDMALEQEAIPRLNAAIALSILFLAPEVVRRWRGQTSFTIRHPWIVAFAFGLLHGFGFASGLAELGLAREQIPLALLMFNVGVEIGQLGFVLAIVLVGRAVRRLEFDRSVIALRFPAYLLGTLGAFWTLQRVAIVLRGLT